MFTIAQIVGLFYIYSFLGWCVEVVYAALNSGKIVNRGFLNGPVCPIYGFGMIAVIELLLPLEDNLPVLFAGGLLLATVIELFGGWALMKLFHTRWWDYSGQPFNLGGYVCLKFSILWGLGAVGMVRIFHPVIYDLYCLLPAFLALVLEIAATVLFGADITITVLQVNGFNHDLKELENLGTRMHDASDALTWKLANAALEADTKLDESRLQWALAKAEGRDEMERRKEERLRLASMEREKLEELLQSMERRKAELQGRMTAHPVFGRGRLLRAFPGMAAELPSRHEVLTELKKELDIFLTSDEQQNKQ